MAITLPVPAPAVCTTFTLGVDGGVAVANGTAIVTYDTAVRQVTLDAAGAGTVQFTAIAGTQPITANYYTAAGVYSTTDTASLTVAAGPAGTIVPTLSVGAGGAVTANATFTCTGATTGLTGTLTYTPAGGAPVAVAVTNGVAAPASLGALTSGTGVTVSFAPAAGTCSPCTFGTVTVPVPAAASCSVIILPVTGTVTAGTPTPVTAYVTCNGLPVTDATVTFSGAASGTATSLATGLATTNLTFPTAGTVTLNATVTATGTACSCTAVAAAPISITVSGVTPPSGTLRALPSCWRLNLPLPFPNLFTAVLRATVSPAAAGTAVNFYVGGQLLGTAATDATGTATLNANLSVFQIASPVFTAVAVLGGTAVSSTAPLLPCIPPL